MTEHNDGIQWLLCTIVAASSGAISCTSFIFFGFWILRILFGFCGSFLTRKYLCEATTRDIKLRHKTSNHTITKATIMMLRSLFLLLASALVVSTTFAEDVLLDFRAGNTKLGVFYQGDQDDSSTDVETEALKGFVNPYGRNTQYIKTSEGFLVRSVDFALRVKVIVWKNTDYKTRDEFPYKLTLKNCDMDSAIEVKAEGGGYVWIEAGQYITQFSDIEHDFEFKDSSGNTLLALRLFPAATSEL